MAYECGPAQINHPPERCLYHLATLVPFSYKYAFISFGDALISVFYISFYRALQRFNVVVKSNVLNTECNVFVGFNCVLIILAWLGKDARHSISRQVHG